MKNLMLTTAATLALTAGAALAQDVVRIGTEGAYPPYNYLDDAGQVAGFEIDLGNEICTRAGLTCEWVVTDWDSIIPNLTSGNYDVIMAGMSITPERDAVIDFSSDYFPPTESAYVGQTDSADITGIVAAQTGTIQAAHAAETAATLLEFATPDETVQAVVNGEADAVIADYDYLLPIVEESGGSLAFVGDRVPLGGGIGAGIRESDTELRETFTATIEEMKADGSLNALLAEWFPDQDKAY